MNVPELLGIAVALAVDAATYSFSYGLQVHRRRAALALAFTVGIFQAFMPLLGYVSGAGLREPMQQWGPLCSLLIFCSLGFGIIHKAFRGKQEAGSNLPLGLPGLLLVGFATSMDAFAVGICMALGRVVGDNLSLLQLALSVGIIGLITFAGALIFFHLAHVLRHLPDRLLQITSGLILIALGVSCVC